MPVASLQGKVGHLHATQVTGRKIPFLLDVNLVRVMPGGKVTPEKVARVGYIKAALHWTQLSACVQWETHMECLRHRGRWGGGPLVLLGNSSPC